MRSAKRTIVVGDVHGCFDELQDLLQACGYRPASDRLIFVGDLINKGPKSHETLKFVRENRLDVVMGNHELKFLKHLQDDGALGPQLADLKRRLGSNLMDWVSWIQSWPSWIEDDEFLVVHAGLVPGRKPSETSVEVLANIRTWDGRGEDLNNPAHPAWHDLYRNDKLVIYGHWALQGLKAKTNSIGLDSGCVYGKQLSAVILPERRIVQVQARKAYQPIK